MTTRRPVLIQDIESSDLRLVEPNVLCSLPLTPDCVPYAPNVLDSIPCTFAGTFVGQIPPEYYVYVLNGETWRLSKIRPVLN
jgi:hypothetical protein